MPASRSASFVLVALAGIASCSYPPSADGRCKVGLTFQGLGAQLDGDYMTHVSTSRSFQQATNSSLKLAYTYTMPDLNHSAYGPDGFGCDHFGGWGPPGGCSKADAEMTRNRWALFEIPGSPGETPAKVVAVCEEGCPSWTPDCKDLFTVGTAPPSQPPYDCPLWPARWPEKQRWRVLGAEGATNVTATMSCCERKPQHCDPCDSGETCSSLIGLLHNNCPPEKGALLHPQTPFQQDCCRTIESPPLDSKSCVCQPTSTVCQH